MSEHLYTFINPTNPKHLDRIDQLYKTMVSWHYRWVPVGYLLHHVEKGHRQVAETESKSPRRQTLSLICNEISMISQGSVGNQTTAQTSSVPSPLSTATANSVNDSVKNVSVGVRVPNEPLTLISSLIMALPLSPPLCRWMKTVR